MIIPTPKSDRTENYWQVLNSVIDPEMGIGIVDLGLVYNVDIKDGIAQIIMTLTTPACPLGPEIMQQINEVMLTVNGVKEVDVQIVWDPVWTQEMMDEDVRYLLWGI